MHFCQILEEKPSSLPWLENRRLEEQNETKKKEGPFKDAPTAIWKPYVSGTINSCDYLISGFNSEKLVFCL